MAVGIQISVEEYLATAWHPDCDYVDGELIERNMGETDHSGVQTALSAWLYNQRRAAGIYVFSEVRVQVGPKAYRIPDIAVTTRKPARGVITSPPFLCIEVLSPEDRMSRIEARIDDYLAFGVPYVWLVDPRRRKVWSYTQEGRREVADALRTSNPDLHIGVEEIFSALDEDVEP